MIKSYKKRHDRRLTLGQRLLCDFIWVAIMAVMLGINLTPVIYRAISHYENEGDRWKFDWPAWGVPSAIFVPTAVFLLILMVWHFVFDGEHQRLLSGTHDQSTMSARALDGTCASLRERPCFKAHNKAFSVSGILRTLGANPSKLITMPVISKRTWPFRPTEEVHNHGAF